MNDSPNIHIFDRRGREIGRVAIKGTDKNPIFEWQEYSNVPRSVKTSIQNLAEAKGWLPRPPLQPKLNESTILEENVSSSSSKGGKGKGGGSSKLNGIFAGLGALSLFLELHQQALDSDQFGYYTDVRGVIIITNLDKAGKNLPSNQIYQFGNDLFIIQDNQFINVKDKTCKLDKNDKGVIIQRCML